MRWWCSIFSFSFLSRARKRLRCCGPWPLSALHVGSSGFEMMTRLNTLMNWWPLIATHTSKPAILYSPTKLICSTVLLRSFKQLDVKSSSPFKSHGWAVSKAQLATLPLLSTWSGFHRRHTSVKSLDIAQPSYPCDQTPISGDVGQKNGTQRIFVRAIRLSCHLTLIDWSDCSSLNSTLEAQIHSGKKSSCLHTLAAGCRTEATSTSSRVGRSDGCSNKMKLDSGHRNFTTLHTGLCEKHSLVFSDWSLELPHGLLSHCD